MTNWILLATSAHAIIYTHDTKKNKYQVLKKFENEPATKKRVEIFSDRPGASTTSFSHGLGAMEDRDSYEIEMIHKFTNEFMEYIDNARHFDKFNSLLIVTTKTMMGHIRNNLSTSLSEKVQGQILKNFYTEKPHELESFLNTHPMAA